MGKDGGGGGGDPGGGGSWDSGGGGGDDGGDAGGGGGGGGAGWGWGAGDGGDGGVDLTQSSDSSGTQPADSGTSPSDTGLGPDAGSAPSDPNAGPQDTGGDRGVASADTGGGPGGVGGGGGGLGGAGGGPDGTGGPADTRGPGGDAQDGELTARDVAAQYGVTDLSQLQSGDSAPDAPAALGRAGAPGAPAPGGGGGYGDPLAASDSSAALSVAAPGDPLGPQGAYGGDPFSVQGAPGTGSVPPTVDASKGPMLTRDNAALAEQSRLTAEMGAPTDSMAEARQSAEDFAVEADKLKDDPRFGATATDIEPASQALSSPVWDPIKGVFTPDRSDQELMDILKLPDQQRATSAELAQSDVPLDAPIDPETGDPLPQLAAQVPRPGPASSPLSVVTNNPGGMWPAAWQQQLGLNPNLAWTTAAGGNKAAVFPDPTSGAAAQFELLSRYAGSGGQPLTNMLAKWGEAAGGPTISAASGIGLNDVVTQDVLSGPKGLALAQAQANWEAGAGRSSVTPDDFLAGQNRAFNPGYAFSGNVDSSAQGGGGDGTYSPTGTITPLRGGVDYTSPSSSDGTGQLYGPFQGEGGPNQVTPMSGGLDYLTATPGTALGDPGALTGPNIDEPGANVPGTLGPPPATGDEWNLEPTVPFRSTQQQSETSFPQADQWNLDPIIPFRAPPTSAPPAGPQPGESGFAEQFQPNITQPFKQPTLQEIQKAFDPQYGPTSADIPATTSVKTETIPGPAPGVVPLDAPVSTATAAPPDTSTTPGTIPEAPSTPGLPPDTGGGRAPAAPFGVPDTSIAGSGIGEPTSRGQFEGGPRPSLPPPPQLVNAMMANASPALQQAAGSLSPAQQTQVTQYAFGLINQYRQMLLSQGGVADPSSPMWRQQILPQIQQQTQQYVLQLTGSANPQAVKQIIASAA